MTGAPGDEPMSDEELAKVRAEKRIQELLDSAPPLSYETRARLAGLLRPLKADLEERDT